MTEKLCGTCIKYMQPDCPCGITGITLKPEAVMCGVWDGGETTTEKMCGDCAKLKTVDCHWGHITIPGTKGFCDDFEPKIESSNNTKKESKQDLCETMTEKTCGDCIRKNTDKCPFGNVSKGCLACDDFEPLFEQADKPPENLDRDMKNREEIQSNTQRLIAIVCDEIKDILLNKNRKYGDSAINPVRIFSKADPVEQINVRIDDKISRLKSCQGDDTEDPELDLIGYLILKRVALRVGR